MIVQENISNLVGNHIAPYIYGNNFIPGETVVPYSGPYWDRREVEVAINAFVNGKWITAGENVSKFEKEFCKRFRVLNSLMVNSGSSANLVMIAALKKYNYWDDNTEIIVSPTGFPTTISVLYQNRLKPVFADIEWDTLNFDLNKVEEKINHNTGAIFLSPVLGNPPDMDRLVKMCNDKNIQLVLDGCDSLGSRWAGKYLGEYSQAWSNSFYPAHHISTGEGGMVCTDDERLIRLMVSMAWWGRDCTCVGANNMLKDGSCKHRFDKWLDNYQGVVDHKYVFSNMGYNLKPLDLQGAIGLVQLEKFNLIEDNRNASKTTIESIVTQIPGVRGVYEYAKANTCWFGTPFICEEEGLKHKLVAHFERHKIQTRNYFSGNILLHPGYEFLEDYRNYPEANKVLDKVFFLGAAPFYGNDVFVYIDKIVKEF